MLKIFTLVPLIMFCLCELCATAHAQTAGADITYTPVQKRGDYDIGFLAADFGTPAVWACIKRVDVMPHEVVGCGPAIPGIEVRISVSVPVTPFKDAKIRGFAYDNADVSLANESLESLNAGDLIFTPPGRPDLRP